MTILNGKHEPTVDQCTDCSHVSTEQVEGLRGVCAIYLEPAYKWEHGPCTGATHLKPPKPTAKERKRVGQQHRVKAAKISSKQQQTYSRVKVPD